MKEFLKVGLIFILLISCNHKRLNITKDYIINDYWNESHYGLNIQKMVPINEIDYNKILSKDYDEANYVYITSRLKIDSSYNCGFWGINASKKYPIKNKIFFTKNNGWEWGCGKTEKKIIGALENYTWYKFSNLKMNTQFFLYIYVDSLGNTHQFHVNNANF